MKKSIKDKVSDKTKPLSTIEWDTLWMAVRYAMNGSTISTASLPDEILKAYYYRLSEQEKSMLVKLLKDNIIEMKRLGYEAFGHQEIDAPKWYKLLGALDTENHFYMVEKANKENKFICFEANGDIIPLERALTSPFKTTVNLDLVERLK